MRQRHDFDFPGQRVAFFAGIHDAQFIEFEVVQGDAHGGREHRGVRALALAADAPTFLEQDEVDLRAILVGPVVGVGRALGL